MTALHVSNGDSTDVAGTERRVPAAVASGAFDAGTAFPLLTASDDRITRDTRLRLTEAGTRVLAGRQDHVGVDRWIGGVRLGGSRPGWRRDEAAEVVMPW